eukprot:8518985-Alexandrium_andersonii.AAC.1
MAELPQTRHHGTARAITPQQARWTQCLRGTQWHRAPRPGNTHPLRVAKSRQQKPQARHAA